jgi:hypothetical protein
MAKSNLNEKWVQAITFLDARILQEGDRAKDLRAARDIFNDIRAESDGLIRQGGGGTRPGTTRDGSAVTHYRVERLGAEDVLAEYRTKAKEPFRCTREIFDKIVEILGKSPKPMHFLDIFDELRRELDDSIPDYRPRVCLRYLVARGLVTHARRRFERTGEPKDFERRVSAAWDGAKRQPWYPHSKS